MLEIHLGVLDKFDFTRLQQVKAPDLLPVLIKSQGGQASVQIDAQELTPLADMVMSETLLFAFLSQLDTLQAFLISEFLAPSRLLLQEEYIFYDGQAFCFIYLPDQRLPLAGIDCRALLKKLLFQEDIQPPSQRLLALYRLQGDWEWVQIQTLLGQNVAQRELMKEGGFDQPTDLLVSQTGGAEDPLDFSFEEGIWKEESFWDRVKGWLLRRWPLQASGDEQGTVVLSEGGNPFGCYLIYTKNRQPLRLDEGADWLLGDNLIAFYQIPAHKGISRQHARIYKHQGQFVLEDLESTNGTSLNGQKLPSGGMHALQSGDEIGLAQEKFIFILEEE